ncbi:lysozyme inhibitor LprI family protein [Maricaulis sp.]|uniref:lysozyme inhibitor LprI family protein n=1 Tax=Maricaulis sp. TaxID=1486257 RepID=UPI0025C02642|nr:lysozyme inhibitor LprI family protein [Maricaulis sp.]
MLVISGLFVAALAGQDLTLPSSRPALECAEYLTDWRARRNCLRGLLAEAEGGLERSVDLAREDADETDADSAGRFGARPALDAAQTAWIAYRDAECTRRAAAMFLSEDSREEITLDCQISLTRARATELAER